jgi:hypothetical protein
VRRALPPTAVAVLVLASACGTTIREDADRLPVGSHERLIAAEDYPGTWPFGPNEGLLRCRRVRAKPLVTLEAQGVVYALSKDVRRAPVEDVRRILLTDHAGLPLDYSPVLKDGLALCGA